LGRTLKFRGWVPALTVYLVPEPWASTTRWASSPVPMATPPLVSHLGTAAAAGGAVVGAAVVVVVGALVVGVSVVVVAGMVVVGGLVVGAGAAGAGATPLKKGSRAKSTNPCMDCAEVSGRQSQRPPWSRRTTARIRGMVPASAPAASRYQPRLRPGSMGSSTVAVPEIISGLALADPQE